MVHSKMDKTMLDTAGVPCCPLNVLCGGTADNRSTGTFQAMLHIEPEQVITFVGAADLSSATRCQALRERILAVVL